jgi:hypothetical protein
VLTLTLLLLTGCNTGPFSRDPQPTGAACPPLYPYTAEEQKQIAKEKDLLPEPSIIRDRVLPNYSNDRDAIRKCLGLKLDSQG